MKAFRKNEEGRTDLLRKSSDGIWMHSDGTRWQLFVWFKEPFEKAVAAKYYTPKEVKARGMRWVTIRGSRVLLQGTSDGGWVVVGGAGGKLNHLKIDKILSKEEYASKREEAQEKKKADLRALSREEMAEFRETRKGEVTAKRELRSVYEAQVKTILGMTDEDFKSQVTGKMMDEITGRARDIVSTRKRKVLDETDQKDVETEKEKIVKQEIDKSVKNVERQALDVLMNDYLNEADPTAKQNLKKMLDTEKAKEVLQAKKDFKKALKEVGTTKDPRPPRLKVGDVFAADSKTTGDEIMQEVKNNIETAKNIALYDRMNAQSGAIQRHVAAGNASAVNGTLSDVFGGGATFSPDAFKELGVDAVARAVAINIQQSGRAAAVVEALKKFSADKREAVVDAAMQGSDERMAVADSLRDLAKGTDDEEGLMTMSQANGYALKELIAAQQELGVAVGSLQGMAHLINALEDPPADAVLVDIGTDLHKARERAKKAGLNRGMYNIRKKKAGGKQLIMEIPSEAINQFITNNKEIVKKEVASDRIKMHKANDGYIPPGMNKDAVHPITKERGPIKLDPSQEAGLRFFKENDKVLLDFEAGLGKTAVAYAAAMEAIHNKGAKKVLVVTPPKLRDQYKQEAGVFLDKENRKMVTNVAAKKGPKGRAEVYGSEAGIHIVGHDQLATDWKEIKAGNYDMIIVDEVHEMTPGGTGKGSQRYRGMMQLRDIPMKIAMSGTNIKNGKVELWKKINFLDPEHTLGSITQFEKRYKGLNQGTSAFQDSSNDAFRKEVSKWIYTQKSALPVNHTAEHKRVPLTSNQRTRLRDVMATYRKEREAGKIGAAARRDANMYRIVHDDAEADNSKAGEIVKVMRESHVGEKAAIHVTGVNALKSTMARLQREFGKDSVVAIMGEPPYDGVEHVRNSKAAFNDPDSPVRFIIGTKSMEAGHNLQGGTVNFHLDQPMTFAAKDQREKRTYRKGQKKDVKTYTLSGQNPHDLRMEDIIKRKKRETEILGNPQEIEGMDGTGFLSYLNRFEKETVNA